MTPKRTFLAVLASVFLASCSGSLTEPIIDGATPSSETLGNDTVSTVADGAQEIAVEVGVDSGPDRIETVPLGALVRISVVNEDDVDEVHLHGYDLTGGEVDPGEPTVFEFVASTAGEFEVESHVTGEVLMILVVR